MTLRWTPFETQVPGKWVLAGEHAVLKGAPAVAMPHPELALKLRFEPGAQDVLEALPAEAAPVLREMLGAAGVLEKVQGQLTIQSTVPQGAGLGSSAALCMAVTRWLAGPLGISRDAQAAFATRLENLFHGESSGMDVAAIAAGKPVRFVRGAEVMPLRVTRLPRFTFHDTGLRAKTRECISKVEAFRAEEPLQANLVDDMMAQATEDAVTGLKLYDAGDRRAGVALLRQSMEASFECFDRWELVPESVLELQESLLRQGALAARLTGAGGGGFVVALWG